jgi:hypothetical protein
MFRSIMLLALAAGFYLAGPTTARADPARNTQQKKQQMQPKRQQGLPQISGKQWRTWTTPGAPLQGQIQKWKQGLRRQQGLNPRQHRPQQHTLQQSLQRVKRIQQTMRQQQMPRFLARHGSQQRQIQRMLGAVAAAGAAGGGPETATAAEATAWAAWEKRIASLVQGILPTVKHQHPFQQIPLSRAQATF